MTEGERLKEEGLSRVKSTPERKAFILRCRHELIRLLRANFGEATIEDVRKGVELPEGFSPMIFGAVTGSLVRTGAIRFVRYTRAERPTSHARPLSVWGLGPAVEAWERANPLPPCQSTVTT